MIPLLLFYNDDFGIKSPTKVDMPLSITIMFTDKPVIISRNN